VIVKNGKKRSGWIRHFLLLGGNTLLVQHMVLTLYPVMDVGTTEMEIQEDFSVRGGLKEHAKLKLRLPTPNTDTERELNNELQKRDY